MKNKMGLLLLMLISSIYATHAQTIVKGIVKDAVSNSVLQSVSVYFKGGRGVTTAADGSYTLRADNPRSTTVQFSYVGYKTTSVTIVPNKEQEVNIELDLGRCKKQCGCKSQPQG